MRMDDLDQDVRWVASQSPIPALQAFIREAERDKKVSSSSTPAPSLPPAAPTARRKPLSASANQPPARSPHSAASEDAYVPQEDEPEAVAFVELLRDAFKTLDENSLKKQRLAARAREKERALSMTRGRTDRHTGSVAKSLSARPLTKTSSASAICLAGPSAGAPQLPSSTSMSFLDTELRGRVLARTASFGASPDIAPGKSLPNSLPSHPLNPNPKPASRLPPRASTMPNARPITARRVTAREPTSHGGDSPMQDVIDLTETDTEWEKPLSAPTSRADTTMYMQVDDDDSDTGMDTSFFQPDPPPPTPVPVPKLKPQSSQVNTVPRPPEPTQRRTGPPPLGMRRAARLPPTQYSSSQSAKGTAVPRFKPPLLPNAGGTTNKNASGTRSVTVTSAKPPPRGVTTKAAVAPKAVQENKDADSSFDISFDMDVDALEEAMKAYD